MKAWLRLLEIHLSSEKLNKKIIFGDKGNTNINIEVEGYKYLSSMKDNFTIKISNLTYAEIITLIDGKYTDVEIKVGYKELGAHTIFKGGVLYISNKVNNRTTNTVYIVCASKLIAKFNEKRLNMTLNSGINMYSALKYICDKAGIPDSNISQEFKNRIVKETINANQSVGSMIDQITGSTDTMFAMSDSSEFGTLSIGDLYKSNNRKIRLDENNIILSGGYPSISSSGVSLKCLPTFNFMPGDILIIPNYLIDLSVQSYDSFRSGVTKPYYVDKTDTGDGQYFITEINYTLANRSNEFRCSILARSRRTISGILGSEE